MNFKFDHWVLPIKTSSKRAIELTHLSYESNSLSLKLFDEGENCYWSIKFNAYHAIKITSEECDSQIWNQLPEAGAFYKSSESLWLTELGKEQVHFLKESLHFVICCYDELIEVASDLSAVEIVKCEQY